MLEIDENQKTPLEEELKRLLVTRRAHRGQMTKLLNKASETMGKDEDDPGNQVAMTGLLDSLQTKRTFLKELDNSLIRKTPETDLEERI